MMKQVTAERMVNVIAVLLQKKSSYFDHPAFAEVADSSLKTAVNVCGPLSKKGVLKKVELEDGSVGYERGPKFDAFYKEAKEFLVRSKNAPPSKTKVEEQLPSPADIAQIAHTEMVAIYFIRAIRAASSQMSMKVHRYFEEVIRNMPN